MNHLFVRNFSFLVFFFSFLTDVTLHDVRKESGQRVSRVRNERNRLYLGADCADK